MTIRLELDSVSDLEEMLRPRMTTEVDLNHARDEVYRLKEELQSVKDELRGSQNYCTQLLLVPPAVGVNEGMAKLLRGVNEGMAKLLREIIEGTLSGDKIRNIKHVRQLTGLGLKEAKDLVEGAQKAGEIEKANREAQRGFGVG